MVRYFLAKGVATERLHPYLEDRDWTKVSEEEMDSLAASPNGEPVDFVWETAEVARRKALHRSARVFNKLQMGGILDDKSKFSYLCEGIGSTSRVETYVINGKKDKHLQPLVEQILSKGSEEAKPKWWICKDAEASSGIGLLVFNSDCTEKLLAHVEDKRVYVIQRYMENPYLWKGCKFDVRCYMVISAREGKLVFKLHKKWFLRTTCVPFALSTFDEYVHLTNTAIQKHHESFGNVADMNEVLCTQWEEYQSIHEQIKATLKELAAVVGPFLAGCQKDGHFELFGVDFLVDSDGKAKLLEVNRSPNLARCNEAVEKDLLSGLFDELIKTHVIDYLLPDSEKTRATSTSIVTNFETISEDHPIGTSTKTSLEFAMYTFKARRRMFGQLTYE